MKGVTFRQFAEEYLRRCDPHWKPSGRKTIRIYLNARILPTFGRMPLDRIGPEDMAAWFDAASRDKPGAANRAFEILRAMMFRAEEWGLRERGANPCLGIAKNPRNHVARSLDTDELARLGRAFDARDAEWPEAVAVIRLLALTGCRRSEVPNLRWPDIGADAINLRDAKTGPRAVPLGEDARVHIGALPGARDSDAFLFPHYAEPHAFPAGHPAPASDRMPQERDPSAALVGSRSRQAGPCQWQAKIFHLERAVVPPSRGVGGVALDGAVDKRVVSIATENFPIL